MAAQTAPMERDSPLLESDLAERWRHFEETAPETVVEDLEREFDDAATRRDLLVSWLAYELDFSRWLNRREELESRPLWELLDREVFERLGRAGERALLAVARSDEGRLEPNLHPKSGLAAVVLWRNARTPGLRDEAERLLRRHPLPVDDWWLYRLAGRFVELRAARGGPKTPGLFQLAALELAECHWEGAARLSALYLVHRCLPVGFAPDRKRLVAACDRAAETRWEREGDWLELMAEAAMQGRLRFPWLEKPVAAALRSTFGGRERRERLRTYHRERLYEVDRARLDRLYGYLLEAVLAGPAETRTWARRRLLEEIDLAAKANPRRALELAELVAIHEHPLRFGSYRRRIRHALHQVRQKEELDLLDRYLAGLYVVCYDVEPHALAFVNRLSGRIDWEANPVGSEQRLRAYLRIGDYERAFEDLTVEVGGTQIEVGDKDAAVRVRHFREKRVERASIVRFLRRMLAPVDWLGSTLRTTDLLEETVERGLEVVGAWFASRDERRRVVEAYADAGVPVTTFDDIATVDADFVDDYTERLGNQRLILGTAAGVAAGALGPLGPEVLALADVPVKALLSREIASRFGWYYGFDPTDHPELPGEILEVALETDQMVETDGPDASLAELAIQTSLFVEALGTRNVGPLAGRVIRGVIEQFTESGWGDALAATAEQWARWTLGSRAKPRRFDPLVGAVAGGIVGGALVYDVSNSARALLTDRFLARKYDDWRARI